METTNNIRIFSPPKVKKIEFSIEIEFERDNYCSDLPYLNELPCSICQNQVGSLRPLGFLWAKTNFDADYRGMRGMRGMRVCNKCYVLLKDGE